MVTNAIFTIGHSTRKMDDFLAILSAFKITCVIDVRSIRRSSYNPQYNEDFLKTSLVASGINYVPLPALGGLRKVVEDSVNAGWRNKSFRGYADYMQTDEFRSGLAELIKLSGSETVVIMCAELLPWRCHRFLISDALVVRNIKVVHILSQDKTIVHELSSFAKVKGLKLTYPAYL